MFRRYVCLLTEDVTFIPTTNLVFMNRLHLLFRFLGFLFLFIEIPCVFWLTFLVTTVIFVFLTQLFF
jgi:hypothetical protein